MNIGILKFVLALAAALPGITIAEADHPELSAADQAYSAEKYDVAAHLYRRDAELGVVAAQVNLAFMYLDGLGVAQDFSEAARWFQQAAEHGNAEAQQNLAMLYRDGKGVLPSKVDAVRWFRIAGARADSAEIEKGMTPEEIASANNLADAWLSEHGKAARQ